MNTRANLEQLLAVVRVCHLGRVVPFPGYFHGSDVALAAHITMLIRLLDDEDREHVRRMWDSITRGEAA